VDDSEGMFPFLLLLPAPINGERLAEELKQRFQQGPWYLKPNTVFTTLKRSDIERATFQVSRRGNPRKGTCHPASPRHHSRAYLSHFNVALPVLLRLIDKISVYISKLRNRDDRYIVEFRRSGRYFQEGAEKRFVWFHSFPNNLMLFKSSVPSEFMPFQSPPRLYAAEVDLPKYFLLPSTKENEFVQTIMHKSDDQIKKDNIWLFRDSRFVFSPYSHLNMILE
jgi:hypothetical protein